MSVVIHRPDEMNAAPKRGDNEIDTHVSEDALAQIHQRATRAFEDHRQAIFARTDRLFAALLVGEWIAAIAAAIFVAPGSWIMAPPSVMPLEHVPTALLSGLVVLVPVLLAVFHPGKTATRHAVAIAQMLMSAVLIHLTAGRSEAHFHVFGSLALLATYRDWPVLATAVSVTVADHFLRGALMPVSIYGTSTGESPLLRSIEHTAWILFEATFLTLMARQGAQEMRESAVHQAEVTVANEQLAETNDAASRFAAEVEASAERFRSLSAGAPVGVFEIDTLGRAMFTNERWSSLTGLGASESLGAGWTRAILPDDRDAVLADFRDAVQNGQEWQKEFRLAAIDGALLWAQVQAKPLRDNSGRITSYVGTVTDMTERKQWLENLRRDKEAAEEANRAKSQFLANMSHELRTPLNAIIGFSEILQDHTFGSLTPKQDRYVGNILTSGRHLLQLINDILDLSKVEAGKVSLEYVTFSLGTAVEDVRNIVKAIAAKKNVILSTNLPPQVQAVTADQGKFKQVLYNLLSNAVKFTPEGGRVTVSVVASPEENLARISVSDTGIGIKAEDRERIFNEFEQVDSSYARTQQGTGLGLALTRKIVELHSGHIWVESEGEGKGSTFSFTLPLSPPAVDEDVVVEPTIAMAAVGTETSPSTTSPSSSTPTPVQTEVATSVAVRVDESSMPPVLLLDTEEASGERLKHYLEGAGYAVRRVHTTDAALDHAHQIAPLAISIDVQQIRESGWSFLPRFLGDSVLSEVPLVLISTGNGQEVALTLPFSGCFAREEKADHLADALLDAFATPPRSVLLITEESTLAVSLSNVLDARGIAAVFCATGESDAVEGFKREKPAVVILDLGSCTAAFIVIRRLSFLAEMNEAVFIALVSTEMTEPTKAILDRQLESVSGHSGKSALLEELARLTPAEESAEAENTGSVLDVEDLSTAIESGISARPGGTSWDEATAVATPLILAEDSELSMTTVPDVRTETKNGAHSRSRSRRTE